MPKYDKIGVGYDQFRTADPFLTERIMFHLKGSSGPCLEIGCGTGNYTTALFDIGLEIEGLEPSEEMLKKAESKNKGISWTQGYAENLPFENESFNSILAFLTIHHWRDLSKGFTEAARVLKNNGRIVLFTSLPDQTASYWLKNYFPNIIEKSAKSLPSLKKIQAAADRANMYKLKEEIYHVKPDLKDGFLYSGKHNPSAYLNDDLRKGISSFSELANEEEVSSGLIKLRWELDNNLFPFYNPPVLSQGDYVFLVFEKVSNDS